MVLLPQDSSCGALHVVVGYWKKKEQRKVIICDHFWKVQIIPKPPLRMENGNYYTGYILNPCHTLNWVILTILFDGDSYCKGAHRHRYKSEEMNVHGH